MPNRIPTPGIPSPAVRKSTASQKAMTGEKALNANIKKLTPAGVKADTARQTTAIAAAHAKSGYGK